MVKNRKKIAFFGWNHPAEKSFEILAKERWVSVLILPELDNWRSHGIADIAKKCSVPIETNLSNLSKYEFGIIICSNYPKLIPKNLIDKNIAINCHWSLLPQYRGMHSTAWALINDEKKIGQTIHFMDSEFDTGDIISQSFVKVRDNMSLDYIFKKMAEFEAKGLHKTISAYYKTGKISRKKQQHKNATYVPQRTPEMGHIEWNWPTRRIWNLIRALPPDFYPPPFSYKDNEVIYVVEAEIADCPQYYSIPGDIVRVIKGEGVWIKTGDTALFVKKIRVGDSADIITADKFLKRGMRLGLKCELEIFALKKRIAELEKLISKLT